MPSNPFDESDDGESDESDDGEMLSDNEEYVEDMSECDYRRTPNILPCFTAEEKILLEEDLDLLKRKGIYPYEYMDSFERLKESEIPPLKLLKALLLVKALPKRNTHMLKKLETLIAFREALHVDQISSPYCICTRRKHSSRFEFLPNRFV